MLDINGQTYETKFSYKFYQRLMDNYGDDNNDGFSRLIKQLVDRDPDALVNGYRYAIDAKNLPSADAVADALGAKGIWDQEDPYGDLYKALKQDGFLRHRLRLLLNSVEEDANNGKKALEIGGKAMTKKEREEAELTVAAYQNYATEFKGKLEALAQ